MKAAARKERRPVVVARRYRASLRRYLQQGPAASLQPAFQLGRQAVSLRLETLDLALIHEQALMTHALSAGSVAARERIIKRSRAFFASAIIPMEQTHRSALESNIHLSRLNKALSRRTQELSASSLQLKREIIRRQVVEKNLRQSEGHTTRLLEESRRLQEQLRLLSHRVLSVQEEERKRISRELHDVIAQMLTGINVRLATLKLETAANTKGLARKIAHTQRLVEKSVNIVHRFARELRPAVLDDLGLLPALHSFMTGFAKETGIRVGLTAFAGVETLSSAKRTALYRVAQEALTNVDRHAQASRVDVSFQGLPNAIRMQVKDNGKSFDPERTRHARKRQHLGLLGMKERVEMVGGTFTVASVPGRGTTIQALIPIHNGSKERRRP